MRAVASAHRVGSGGACLARVLRFVFMASLFAVATPVLIGESRRRGAGAVDAESREWPRYYDELLRQYPKYDQTNMIPHRKRIITMLAESAGPPSMANDLWNIGNHDVAEVSSGATRNNATQQNKLHPPATAAAPVVVEPVLVIPGHSSGGDRPHAGSGGGDVGEEDDQCAPFLKAAAADTEHSNGPLSNVWMFWETPLGGRKPGYIELCERTVREKAGRQFKVNLLDKRAAKKLMPDLPRDLDSLLPGLAQ